MSVLFSLTAAALLTIQTAPEQSFRLTGMTVTDIDGATEINDLRNVFYIRVSVRSSDGIGRVVYVPGTGSERHRIWKTDICSFEGLERLWVGDRSFHMDVSPEPGEAVLIANDFQCREGPDGRPPDPPVDPLFLSLPPPPPTRSATVVMVGVGDKPPFPSGIVHTSTLLLGQSEEGDIDPYYLTYFGEEFPVPPLGSRCLIEYRPGRLELVGGLSVRPLDKGDYISSFDCSPPPSREDMARRNMAQ